jgi:hypothetical protein
MASLLFSKLFDEMGVPAGYRFKQLLFSPRANSVVRHASSAMNDWRPERIYFHRVGRVSPSWQSWGIGFARISFHTFFETTACVHDDAARLFNRSRRPRTTPHKLAFSSDRRLIKRLGGPLDRPGIVAGINRLTRFWICEIVAFGEQGLFVKTALSKNESLIEDFVAELSAENLLKPIVLFPAVFL